MFNIQTLNKISPLGLKYFKSDAYTYGDSVENPDAVLVRSANMHEMDFSKSLKAIARAGAGVNNIPIDKCSENGIVVFNTPGMNANAVKELVVAALLLSSRRIVDSIEWVKTVKDEPELSKLIEKGKSKFAGPEILGKTLGVIGLGAIGGLVANAGSALGMKVIGCDPYLSTNAALNLSCDITLAESFKEIFAKSDYISIHAPLCEDTKEMINASSLAIMKNGVRIMNFARGGLVNSADLLSAIESGKLACYVTDFPSADLIGKDGIIAIPHLGASTPESEDNCAECAALEIIDYLENGNIKNSVNYPAFSAERETAVRFCILHKENSETQFGISSALSNAGFAIASLATKTKGENCYTVADVDANGDIENAKNALSALAGVAKVRALQ